MKPCTECGKPADWKHNMAANTGFKFLCDGCLMERPDRLHRLGFYHYIGDK
jgi:hypothetical protein